WRTFRVDRMREGLSPGPRFTPRELSDADAEALVARGVPPEARRHQARVTVHAPAAELVERWGPMLGPVTSIDDSTCVIQTGADSVEQLAAWLANLGVDFRVTEPPELVEAIRALSRRFGAAAL